MNDLETSLEHTEKQYLWRASKRGHRVHIENPETERAYCQVENCGGKLLDGRGAEVPAGRRICGNCIELAGRNETDYREPDIRVLMGERLAETEPELFAIAAAPKPREREKQTKVVHRLKAGKTKPGKVKHQKSPGDRPGA